MRITDVDTVWNSLEIAKFVVSAITPVFVICFGYLLNRKLDGLKTTKEWQKIWAEKFLEYSHKMNEMTSLFIDGYLDIIINFDKDIKRVKELQLEVEERFRQIRVCQYNIKNYAQFASEEKENRLKTDTEELFKLLQEIRECCDTLGAKHPDFKQTDKALLNFNKAARDVHYDLFYKH